MTTQGRQYDEYRSRAVTPAHIESSVAGEIVPGVPEPKNNERDWFQMALYVIAVVAVMGLGIALLGVYALDNPLIMLVGALMVSGSAVIWIVGAWFVIGAWLMRRYRRRPGEPPQ